MKYNSDPDLPNDAPEPAAQLVNHQLGSGKRLRAFVIRFSVTSRAILEITHVSDCQNRSNLIAECLAVISIKSSAPHKESRGLLL